MVDNGCQVGKPYPGEHGPDGYIGDVYAVHFGLDARYQRGLQRVAVGGQEEDEPCPQDDRHPIEEKAFQIASTSSFNMTPGRAAPP
jgi:hypothetical protein